MIAIKNIFFLNEIGQRPQLEDAIYPFPGKASIADRLFIVCDGVGGENFGEEASRITCEALASFAGQNPPPESGITETYIENAQRFVLQQMQQYVKQNPEAPRMSTTLTLAYRHSNSISVAWCGDSRIYHMRGDKILWRSTDHSLVASLVKHGEITEEEARTHPKRNIITRSISLNGEPSSIDLHHIANIEDGDYLLLCTDGILEQVTEDRLGAILLNEHPQKEELVMAYTNGQTRDNFSLYLLELGSDKKSGRGIKTIIALLLLAALITSAAFYRGTIQNWFNRKDSVVSNPPAQAPAQQNQNQQPPSAGDQVPLPKSDGQDIGLPSEMPAGEAPSLKDNQGDIHSLQKKVEAGNGSGRTDTSSQRIRSRNAQQEKHPETQKRVNEKQAVDTTKKDSLNINRSI